MKKQKITILLRTVVASLLCCATLLSCGGDTTSPQNFKVYPAPDGIELSDKFVVEVEGCNVPLYQAIVPDSIPIPRLLGSNGKSGVASMALFDINGPVSIKVSSPEEIKSVKILPTSYNIEYKTNGQEITFSIDKPMHVTVEINGNWHESLHISANPFETDVPNPDDENVIYFGPGVHDITCLHVGDNQTVYIAGGAYIRCQEAEVEEDVEVGHRFMPPPSIFVVGDNVTIRGRGIIDGKAITRPKRRYMLLVKDSKNVTIEGITLFDSSYWTMPIKSSDNVHIDNIKLTGWRGNADGVDISNSRDVLVENSFFRTYDDLVVVKTFKGLGEVKNVHVRNCVGWSEIAHAFSIGAEIRENVTNVLFEDCDVIHDVGRETALRIYHCDSAVISDVVFQNIRIEEARRLISVWIGKTRWTETPERGHVKNIIFRNIEAVSAPIDPTLVGFQDGIDWKPYTIKDKASIEIIGWDEDHLIEDVVFDNVVIDGKKATEDDITVQNEFHKNTIFK